MPVIIKLARAKADLIAPISVSPIVGQYRETRSALLKYPHGGWKTERFSTLGNPKKLRYQVRFSERDVVT
jgi:hypothetical protein